MPKKNIRKNTKIFYFIVAVILILILLVGAVWFFGIEKHTFSDFSELFNNKSENNLNNNSLPAFETLSDTKLFVHFIDVGQGDCILIVFPDGKEMLIDCGNYNNSGEYKQETLNYLSSLVSDGQIDYLMLTHCDSDHVYFLDEVLNIYDVDNIYLPNVLSSPENEEKATEVAALDSGKLALFNDSDTVSTICYADFFIGALSEKDANIFLNIDEFEIKGGDYSISFYGYTNEEWAENRLKDAEEKNAISPIGILEYSGIKLVLTGDSNFMNEASFLEKIGGGSMDCDVLKVAHHGSASSSSAEFLDFVDCEYAVISCNSKGNNFNHPRQETLDRLEARAVTVFRTDLNGTVIFAVDNLGKFAFKTEKNEE